MPPIACKWKQYHLQQAVGWDTPYTRQIEEFQNIMGGNDVAMREVAVDVE